MAASVRLALHALLNADATLTAAVDGIHHQEAPQDAEHPFVIFHKQSGTPRWTLGGPPVEWELWTVKVVGFSSGTIEPIAARIETLLDGATLNVDGRATLDVRRESDVNYATGDGATTYRHLGGMYRVATG